MRPIRALLSLALVGLAAGCGGGDSGPTPGVIDLTLNTPNSGDGAILFRVTGGEVDSIAPSLMVASGSFHSVGTTTRVVAAGALTDGVLVHLFVPDAGKASKYAVTIEQVAASSNFAQRSLVGYTLTPSLAP